jgi:xylan 1,4-beta-xylosidase
MKRWAGSCVVLAVAIALSFWTCGCGSADSGARPDVGAQGPVAAAPDLTPGERTVTVEADRPVGECWRFWLVGNHNKPHTLVEGAGGIREIKDAEPLVTEINCVYLLGGRYLEQNRWFLGLDDHGRAKADFRGMIAQLKGAIDAGYTPRVVLDNVPYNMSDPPRENFYGNTAPPKDERVWHDYVQQAVQAMVDAFGREAVSRWWFRVGTEPDLYPAHWAGTREQYFAHYDYTVDAVTRVLPEARIGPGNILNPGPREFMRRRPDGRRPGGGQPGTGQSGGDRPDGGQPGGSRPAEGPWGLDVIDHAGSGVNACTGAVGARVTVFSCSWYARVGRSLDNFDKAFGAIQDRLSKYPQFKDVVLEAGEFAVLGDERGRRLYAGETTEWSASFEAALADRVYARGVSQLYEWDHATLGVFHPRGRVLQMLDRMAGGRRLAVTVEHTSAADSGAVACRQGDRLLLLVYNHRPERRPQVPEGVHLVVNDQRMQDGAAWRLSEWSIDEQHGVWAYAFEADYTAAGLAPLPDAGLYEGCVERLLGEAGLPIFRKNAEKYARLSVAPKTRDDVPVTVGQGQLKLDLRMPGHGVRFIELSPPR